MPVAKYARNVNIVMSIPGRLRVKIPQLYRSEQDKAEMEIAFAACKYVSTVYANPLTACVLILFDPAVAPDVILAEFGLSAPAPKNDGREKQANNKEHRRSVRSAQEAEKRIQRDKDDERTIYAPWHLQDANAALGFFGSSRQFGLPSYVVEERLRDGLNRLPQQEAVSSFDILLNQFKSLPVLLLGVSALLSTLTGGLSEAAAIVAVLALNGGIGFATERRAESTIASLSELVDDIVPVLRNGEVRQVEASHIVPGDILVLAPGIRIAADTRVLEAHGLSIDESALTGESMPVRKDPASLPRPAPLAERTNMAYCGTAVSMGSGLALVVGTAGNTEIGAIQSLMASTQHPRTPIQRQLDQLGNQLVKLSTLTCIGVFGLGLLRGYHWLHMLKASISLAIAAVPEGLPTVATTSLARGIRLMRDRNVLIRRLHAVETLGGIQTICLDKTGTLTMNRMSTASVQTLHYDFDMHDGRLAWQGEMLSDFSSAELSRLLLVCVLCNQAELKVDAETSSINGSSTESALIDLAMQAGLPVAETQNRYPLLTTELRAEGRNYMRTVHVEPDARLRLVAVKGSPMEVLNLCAYYQSGETISEMNETIRADIARQNQRLAERQLRVLGFAYAEIATTEIGTVNQQELVWLGLVGLADPLRSGVETMIASLHKAGIRTVMLTGDQAATAYAIGKSLRLNNGPELHIVNSERMEYLGPEKLRALCEQADIFSRVSPSHKLQIVQALRQSARIIAMTGDGINDGPALQAADIGIAMGHGGTDLARSAADVVLKDDRLETLLEAVNQGRMISRNIRKSLHFLISSNLSEILVVAGSISLGAGHPLTPMQLLWLNLLSDVLPAIALTAEAAEADVMEQAPRDPEKPMIGKPELLRYTREGTYLAGGTLAAYLYGATRYGPSSRASTIAFNSLIFGQLLHALSCRSDRHSIFSDEKVKPNRQLHLAIGASIGVQLLAPLIPGLRRLLGVEPMKNVLDIIVMLGGAGFPFVLNEAAKRKIKDEQEQKKPIDTPAGHNVL